jgi:hypothetical protein
MAAPAIGPTLLDDETAVPMLLILLWTESPSTTATRAPYIPNSATAITSGPRPHMYPDPMLIESSRRREEKKEYSIHQILFLN